jgi:hypothetical protein
MRQLRFTFGLYWVLQCGWMLAIAHTFAWADHPEQCDPAKVLTSGTCAKCHAAEMEVWKNTPHFRTFDTLHRLPQAKEIAHKMGISSIKRSTLCTQCHYTQQVQEGGTKVVSGVSCESCHGAAKDWIALHNDYGGPQVSQQQETLAHREARVRTSIENGMRNPHNLYLIARSCLACHTVPHEKMVNIGGHKPGSLDFNLVAWSQGKLKHNFLSHNGVNQPSAPERLRVMYLVGLVAELEFSTRATAQATEKGKYGLTVATRAAQTATRLYDIQQQMNHPLLGEIITAFAEAELRTHNTAALNAIADRIRQAGERLAEQVDGRQLSFLDADLPPPSQYK